MAGRGQGNVRLDTPFFHVKEREYIGNYQIRLMPTQVFYNAKGIETGRHMGKISAEDILAQLGLAQPGTDQNSGKPKASL